MKIILFTLFLASVAVAGEKVDDGFIRIAKFELSAPAEGSYASWRDPKTQIDWYAGVIIQITNATFRYRTFSDVIDSKHPWPNYAGPVKVFADHIYLDHPGIPYPYRVAGKADGTPVLVTWEGYEQWKKDKKIFELNVLWFCKDAKEARKTTSKGAKP